MGADSVDIFKKVIFSIPDFREVLAAIFGLGFIYAGIFWASSALFTLTNPDLYSTFLIAVFGFIIPAIVLGELLYYSLPDYPRKWGYFLALCNESILFVYSLILTGANNYANAWHIFWLSLATIYISSLFVLLFTVGDDYLPRIAALSSAQSLSVLIAFHVFVGVSAGLKLFDYVLNLGVLVVAGGLVLFAFLLTEYLIRVNTENVSVLQLTAGLLQKRQEALDLGYPTEVDVQSLEIENSFGSLDLCIPWIHPGPLEGFGGGMITADIIDELNQDGQGFFLHVPSTHKSDPADPESYSKIVEAMEEPAKTGEASKLISRSYEGVDFYGRKVDRKKIVFMDADWDDYELSVFREIIDTDEVIIVDLHCHDADEEVRDEVWYNTQRSQHLREKFRDFLSELESADVSDYSAGFSTSIGDSSVMAMVEEVEDQKTLAFGLEGNGTSEEIRELGEELRSDYDEVLVFSTDTHQSIHEMASSKHQAPLSLIREAIEEAEKTVSPATIGFSSSKTSQIDLLQEDYHSLVFSINILTRLLFFTLATLYIWLVVWIFF